MEIERNKRGRGTNRNGTNWTPSEIWTVFNKADIAIGFSPSEYRRDRCGALIKLSEHGNTASTLGWEIDHIYPVSLGGGDQWSNLQPLQWQNNRAKGDGLLLVCIVNS